MNIKNEIKLLKNAIDSLIAVITVTGKQTIEKTLEELGVRLRSKQYINYLIDTKGEINPSSYVEINYPTT